LIPDLRCRVSPFILTGFPQPNGILYLERREDGANKILLYNSSYLAGNTGLIR